MLTGTITHTYTYAFKTIYWCNSRYFYQLDIFREFSGMEFYTYSKCSELKLVYRFREVCIENSPSYSLDVFWQNWSCEPAVIRRIQIFPEMQLWTILSSFEIKLKIKWNFPEQDPSKLTFHCFREIIGQHKCWSKGGKIIFDPFPRIVDPV